MTLLAIVWHSLFAAAIIFLIIVLVLVAILLTAKNFLVNSGDVAISINDGKKLLHTQAGKTLLATLSDNGVHLSSA